MPDSTRILRSGVGAASGAGTARAFSANTNSEFANIYRYVDNKCAASDAKLDGFRSEMKGELALVAASVREAEAKRSEDYTRLSTAVELVRTTLPTRDDIRKSTRNWAIGLGGFIVALASLLWMFFDTGAAISGAVTDQVVGVKISEQKRASDVQEIKGLIEDMREERSSDEPKASSGKR